MTPLSDREVDVIEGLLEGLPIPAIAQNASRTPKEIEAQVRNIYGKLGVSNRKELRVAYRSWPRAEA